MAWVVGSIIASAVLLALVVLHIPVVRTVLGMIERTPPLSAGDADPNSQAEVFRFPAADGLMLTGSLLCPDCDRPRGLIVFCPELGAVRWSALSYCQALIDAGFAVFAFDFRNHGDSESQPGYEPIHWATEFELDDVRGALRFVLDHDELNQLPLALFGVSRGGTSALTVASEFDDVRCVACEGAYSSHEVMRLFSRRYVSLFGPNWIMRHCPGWHTDAMLFFARMVSQIKRGCRYVRLERYLPLLATRPVLLISGERDNYVLPDVARNLARGINSDQASLWIVPDARHNQAREAASEEYDRRVVAFFNKQFPLSPARQDAEADSESVEPSLAKATSEVVANDVASPR